MDTPNESPRRGTDGGFEKRSILAEVDTPENNASKVFSQPDADEFVPLARTRAASELEIAEAIGSYNNAVTIWNRQEADTSRPLPRHLIGGRFTFTLGFTRRTRGVVATRTDGASLFLRTRRWHPFAGGWSCARRVLARVDVAHAEVRVPRMAGDHE